MESLKVDFPGRLAAVVKGLVVMGRSHDERERARRAVAEFMQRHGPSLTESYQLEDVEWARQRIESSAGPVVYWRREASLLGLLPGVGNVCVTSR